MGVGGDVVDRLGDPSRAHDIILCLCTHGAGCFDGIVSADAEPDTLHIVNVTKTRPVAGEKVCHIRLSAAGNVRVGAL